MFFFDPSKVESVFSLQPGTYTAVISAVELKSNNARTGEYLEVHFSVNESTLKMFYNVKHVNPTAEKMGLGELKRLYAAAGLGAADVRALIGKRVVVDVDKIENESTGKEYIGITNLVLPQTNQTQTQTQTQNVPARSEPPQQRYRQQNPPDYHNDIPPF